MPDREVLLPRLVAQRLAGPQTADVVDTTRHLLAIQGQDPRGARLALRARTVGTHVSDVNRALTDERSLIITWVNRGTLHLIAAEDEPLLHSLTTPQLRRANERRLEQEGVSAAAARRGVDAVVKALGSNGPMTRGELRDVLDRARVPTAGQALVHVLFKATLDGHIIRGPLVGDDHAFVLAADWLGERPKLDRGQALAELARRYLAGHGPASEGDLSNWARLTLRDVRLGLTAIASEIEQRPDGLLDLRGRRLAEMPPVLLLGPFDPLLLGWRSRDFVLGGAQRVVTTNGIFRPVALIDGRAAGTWTMRAGRVQLELWGRVDTAVKASIQREREEVEAFLRPL